MSGFFPTEHTVDEVLAYCLDHSDEVPVILLRELAGRNRTSVMETLIIDMGATIHQLRGFEMGVRNLHVSHPYIALDQALRKVDGGEISLVQASPRERAEWILEQPTIVELMALDKKINAIKEVRALGQLGLKEAKDAVELAAVLQKQGYMSKAQRKQLEIEEKEAIASILGG